MHFQSRFIGPPTLILDIQVHSIMFIIGPNTHQPIKKLITVRRGEGGAVRKGGPLWSPACPLPLSTPRSPLRTIPFKSALMDSRPSETRSNRDRSIVGARA